MRNPLLHTCFALTLSGLLGQIAIPTSAQYITTNTTINTDFPNDAYIGTNGDFSIETSPTVNLVSGGVIEGQTFVFNNSTVNIAGGTIANSYVFGGPTSDCVYLYTGNCTVNFDSGIVAGGLTADAGTINVNGGRVGGSVTSSGGTFNNSPVNLGTVNIYGGAITGDVGVFQLGTVNLYGGNVGGNLYATFGGTFNIYGQGLSETLLASDVFAPEPDTQGFLYWFYDIYALSGTLDDGTSLAGTDLYVSDFLVPQVNLIDVPEPGNIALLAAFSLSGMLGFVSRKRPVPRMKKR